MSSCDGEPPQLERMRLGMPRGAPARGANSQAAPMVTPASPGVGGTHRCSRAFRCCALANHFLVKMFEQAHVAIAFSATPPVSTSGCAGRAQQMIDEMNHGISNTTASAAPCRDDRVCRACVDVLDAQHRVRIP